MPKVTFKEDNKTVDVPVGTSLIEVCNKNDVSYPFFSCEDGTCGTCLCPVDKPENLDPNPPGEKEKERLSICCAKPNERLACQVKVKGDVVISSPYNS
ncbi:MAG: 2Fe-2S iron-sulfur cluster-binding protein [Candidatus Nanoarchaeia archaeon]|nr:2Fe-2S iron-sulfur cluster-binding protein [Candidatus Nanoarchaeia archaeon]